MSFLTALKIFCDLTLPAAAAAVVIPWFSLTPGNFLPSMLCCAAGILLSALAQKRAALRFVGALPCLCALAFCESHVDAAVVVLMIAYCLWLIWSDSLTVSYGGYRDFFKTGAAFHGGCFFLASLNMDWGKMLPYAVLYFVIAVFLLRNLRLGAAGSRRNMLLNFFAFSGTVALGVALCLVGYTLLCLLRYPVAALYFGIVDGLLEIFREAVYFFGEILTYLVMFFAALLYRKRDNEVDVEGSGGGEPPVNLRPDIEPNAMANSIASMILILLVVGAMIFLARKAAKLMERRRDGKGRRIYTQRIGGFGNQQGEKVTGNRARVRSVYRKFLRLVLERGGELKINDTSEDVLRAAALVADGKVCCDLREVYISARYDSSREVTGEQVKEAKKLYKRLKEPQV